MKCVVGYKLSDMPSLKVSYYLPGNCKVDPFQDH